MAGIQGYNSMDGLTNRDSSVEALVNAMSSPVMKARLSPGGFAIMASDGRWKLAPHLSLLNRKLVDCATGRCKRLIVMMPPRSGKSMLVSQYFPAWVLGTYPDKRVILASYNETFAETWGRKARDVLELYGKEIFNVEVSNASAAASRWDIAGHQGGMSTAGAGGSLTGRGADVLIIDDPIKSDKEANSQKARDSVWEWFTSTAYSRLMPGGSIVLVQTRWHQQDLAGRIIEQMEREKKRYEEDKIKFENGEISELRDYERWEIIRFPAIAEEDEFFEVSGEKKLFRKKDEALWPEMFDVKVLMDTKTIMGSYWWAALYQQSPTPQGGGAFKSSWFRSYRKSLDNDYYELLNPENTETVLKRVEVKKCRHLMFIDTAGTISKRSDYTVMMTVAFTPDKEILVTNLFREKIETNNQGKALRDEFYSTHPLAIYVENKTFGTSLIQSIKTETGLPIRPLSIKPNDDKLSRSYAAQARMETGMIYFNVDLRYLEALKSELVDFPTGEHDDMVDCLSYAALELQFKPEPRIRRL